MWEEEYIAYRQYSESIETMQGVSPCQLHSLNKKYFFTKIYMNANIRSFLDNAPLEQALEQIENRVISFHEVNTYFREITTNHR